MRPISNKSLILGVLTFVVFFFIDFLHSKIGFSKHSSTLDPLTWSEYLSHVPIMVLVGSFLGLLIMLWHHRS